MNSYLIMLFLLLPPGDSQEKELTVTEHSLCAQQCPSTFQVLANSFKPPNKALR